MWSVWLKRVRHGLVKSKMYKFNKVLGKPEVQIELSKLKDDFVLTPVDKDAKNISIILVHLCRSVLKKLITEFS